MKKSISVKEMYTMLGISKVTGYNLIKQGLFETIYIANQTRVLVDSFEEWYAHQMHYTKVDGCPPGQTLKKDYYTEREVQNMLGIAESTAYTLIRKGAFKTVEAERRKVLIDKNSFEEWYASQFHYKKVDGEAPGSVYPPSYSVEEIRKLLGYKRRDGVYYLLSTTGIKHFMVDHSVRIDQESFDNWYQNK